jgi:outer membrane biosynthesis protein TonB
MAEEKKSKKGLIIGVVLVLGFMFLTCGGGGGYVAWKYYWQPRQEAKKMLEAMGSSTPDPSSAMTPAPEASTPAPAETEAAPGTTGQVADATPAPTAEVSDATAPPPPPPAAPKKTKPPKTAAPATKAPTEEPTEPPKPKKTEYEISHVHGGLRSKACTGTIQLLDTGFKYDATSSEDDRQDHASYTFSQIKKAEQKDYKTIEISTTDKKWTFKGDGIVLAKVVTFLNGHQSEFAGK